MRTADDLRRDSLRGVNPRNVDTTEQGVGHSSIGIEEGTKGETGFFFPSPLPTLALLLSHAHAP